VGSAAEVKYCYRHPERETGLSCSECGRPICPDCMTVAPVGIRCPEHSGKPQGVQRVTRSARRAAYEGTGALVTKALIALNVLVYLVNLAQGSSLGRTSGWLFEHGALFIGPFVLSDGTLGGLADGEWWRLVTSAFLHGNIGHIAMNMIVLWYVGGPLETALGRGRFLLLYLVSGLAGSAGALLLSPDDITVGASGAVYGIFGAAFVLERQGINVLGGQALGLIVVNLLFTLAFWRYGISLGGHLGGLAGGALGMLALSRLGRTHGLYGRAGMLGMIGVAAVGALSIAVAYLQVQRFI
jgi:membrane associated rhomboid family serine protease